jgi:RimJ/RimL family protein N-acetyltransferase
MGDVDENAERPVLNVEGELVALGPLRRDLLPLYQRGINNLGTVRTLDLPPYPLTREKDEDWYNRQARAEDDVPFTIYERETLRPLGNTGLHEVDYRNRTASFGIIIGKPECRDKGYGTETTRLMLDYAFTALGLHNVMLIIFEFNAAGTGFRSCEKIWAPRRRTSPDRRTAPSSPAGAASYTPGGTRWPQATRAKTSG